MDRPMAGRVSELVDQDAAFRALRLVQRSQLRDRMAAWGLGSVDPMTLDLDAVAVTDTQYGAACPA